MEAFITDEMIQMWLTGTIDLETLYFNLKREIGVSDYAGFVDKFMEMAIERYG